MNKKKILGTVFVIALVAMFGIFAYNQGQLYQQYLNEDIGMQKVPFGAYMTLIVIKPDGSSYIAWEGHNVLTTVGLNASRIQIAGTATAAFDYIAIGTGTGQGAGHNALATEVFRAQGATDFVTTAAGNWTVTYTWPATTFSGQSITEAGCFNASSGGVMLNVQSFSAIPLTAADSLQVTFEFMIAQG